MEEIFQKGVQEHVNQLSGPGRKVLVVVPAYINVEVESNEILVIGPGDVEDLLEDQTNLKSFNAIIAANSIFTTADYVATLIAFHKLLIVGSPLISYDLMLNVPEGFGGKLDSEFEPEIEFLANDCGYLSSSTNNQSNLEAKLEKYCFGEINLKSTPAFFEEVSNEELRINLCETNCIKMEASGALMEPRVRDADGFRSRAAAAIIRRTDDYSIEVLLLKRKTNGWSFPGGGVELNETFDEAVLRECFEESGTKCKILQQFEIIKDEEKKTLTMPFILECMEEVDEYPENHREKSWIPLESLREIHESGIDETDFFGKKLTSHLMLTEIWQSLNDL